MKFRTAYDKPKRVSSSNFGASRTLQEQTESTEIINILDRFRITGNIEHVAKYEPQYGEFAQFDFHATQNQVKQVEQMFDALPSAERKQFGNDPQKFLDFVANQENIEDMRDGTIDGSSAKDVSGSPASSSSEQASESAAETP